MERSQPTNQPNQPNQPIDSLLNDQTILLILQASPHIPLLTLPTNSQQQPTTTTTTLLNTPLPRDISFSFLRFFDSFFFLSLFVRFRF